MEEKQHKNSHSTKEEMTNTDQLTRVIAAAVFR